MEFVHYDLSPYQDEISLSVYNQIYLVGVKLFAVVYIPGSL